MLTVEGTAFPEGVNKNSNWLYQTIRLENTHTSNILQTEEYLGIYTHIFKYVCVYAQT